MYENVIKFIQNTYQSTDFIPLHEPRFFGNEKKYINECIDSTFVSSVGKFVNEFEEKIAKYTGSKFAIATSSGTSALHVALLLSNVGPGDEVITQPLSFIATCNAIRYCGAQPIFVDVDKDTMGLSPCELKCFLKNNTSIRNEQCINNKTGKIIKACVPMHTFGHPCRIDEIKKICDQYHILLVEDAAESVGSLYNGEHTGTFGQFGVMSFNGNKIITAGGGGCIITDNEELAIRAKHLTTTAKVPHKWEFNHDEIGYNYRMPNLNAALLVGQLEQLDSYLKIKRNLSKKYKDFFNSIGIDFLLEAAGSKSNYWLNAVILDSVEQRDLFLEITNNSGVMTRPTWTLINKLSMFKNCQRGSLVNAEWLADRVVNIPSSVINQ